MSGWQPAPYKITVGSWLIQTYSVERWRFVALEFPSR
jgi:hypothetical protein